MQRRSTRRPAVSGEAGGVSAASDAPVRTPKTMTGAGVARVTDKRRVKPATDIPVKKESPAVTEPLREGETVNAANTAPETEVEIVPGQGLSESDSEFKTEEDKPEGWEFEDDGVDYLGEDAPDEDDEYNEANEPYSGPSEPVLPRPDLTGPKPPNRFISGVRWLWSRVSGFLWSLVRILFAVTLLFFIYMTVQSGMDFSFAWNTVVEFWTSAFWLIKRIAEWAIGLI